MSTENDASELRALQAMAYGRGGVLSDDDSRRLAELERRASDAQVVAVVDDGARIAEDAGPADPLRAAPDDLDVPAMERDEGPSESDAADPARPDRVAVLSALRSRWPLALIALVVVLMLGVGTGWLLFGRGSSPVALTAAQQERRAALDTSGDFDAGSVRLIGRDDDALVWHATAREGVSSCLVLDIGDRSAQSCRPEEYIDMGVSVSLTLSEESDQGVQVSATAVTSTSGELVAVVQRWDMGGFDWLAQFEDDERARAEELVDDGFDPYLSLVGYFRDAPVWHAQKYADLTPQDCMIVDAVEAIQCVPAWNSGAPNDLPLTVQGVQVDSNGITQTWMVELHPMSMSSPYLVVVDGSSTGTVQPGDAVELGGEGEDPIRVSVPGEGDDG